jgi:membrane fusion protein, multidrug efflux system
MKKYLILLVITALILGACSKPQGPEAMRKQLAKYQAEMKSLELKIKELEDKLANDSTGEAKTFTQVAVSVDTLQPAMFRHYFEVGGSIEAMEDAYISPEVNGQIKYIYVKKGQSVQKGQLLAKLNTEITESSIREVETNLRLAKLMFEKQEELWNQKIGSEIQYLQAKSNKESLEARLATMNAQLEMANVRAPFSGIVDEIYRKMGEMAVPGVQMMKMVSLGDLVVKADVSEAYLTKIKLGDSIDIEFPSYGSERISAKVSRMGNIISTINRTFPVEARIRNSNGKYKPNSMALLHINDYSHPNAISVPSIIVKQDVQKGYFIFVIGENAEGIMVAQKRFIKPGKSYQGQTEILSGLEPGETVITQGYNTVSNGSPVRIVTQ